MIGIEQVDLSKKRVLIRSDLNVPIQEGRILSDARLQAAIPSIKRALEQNAAVLVISHLGRPIEGQISPEFSLKPLIKPLSQLLNHPVRFEPNWLNDINIKPGEIVLGENVRFNKGEESNDETLAKKMAVLCDIFVMDAFASAHRTQASTVGVARYAPMAVAGLLLETEIAALNKFLCTPKKPLVAIVGGAKVSTKLVLLKALLSLVDILILGGGIANTFLVAKGYSIGESLYEKELVSVAKALLQNKTYESKIVLPEDVVVSTELSEQASTRTLDDFSKIEPNEKIFDVGPKTVKHCTEIIQTAETILWNGPMGVFEKKPFEAGTRGLALAIKNSKAFSLAGGGETVAAIEKYGVLKDISYVSTGGAAFLEYLEGKSLPGIEALNKN